MARRLRVRGLRLALAGVGAVALFAGIASATIPDSNGVIHACYRVAADDRQGEVRIVSDPSACRVNEAPIQWNQVGPQGPAGLPGAQGPQGEKGERGEAGPQGPQGEQGPIGLKGDTGAQGPAGPAGAKGDTGAQGPAGPAGAKGDTGEQGPQGPEGPAGPAGPSGTGPTILTAVVDANGTLVSGNGAIAVHHPPTENLRGWYAVEFNRDLRSCVGIASLRQKYTGDFDHSGEIATTRHGGADSWWVVETFDSGDNLLGDEHVEDRPFTLVLFCSS